MKIITDFRKGIVKMEGEKINISIRCEDMEGAETAFNGFTHEGTTLISKSKLMAFNEFAPDWIVYVFEQIVNPTTVSVISTLIANEIINNTLKGDVVVEVEGKSIQVDRKSKDWKDNLDGFLRERTANKIESLRKSEKDTKR